MPAKLYSVRVTFWQGPTKVYRGVISHTLANGGVWELTQADYSGTILRSLANVKTLEVI